MGDNSMNKNVFLHTIKQLNNSAVLLKREEDGNLISVFVSPMFAKMMECDIEDAVKISGGKGFLDTTHQDDKVFVKRMLRRRIGEDGTKELTIRKYTAKGNMIWCKVCFSFIDDYDVEYIYCTYSDVTAFKDYEEQLRISYMNMGDNFYHVGEKTLSMLRADLTMDAVEDIQGRDNYGTDSMVYHFSEVQEKRSVNYPIFEERQRFLEKFSREFLTNSFHNGITRISDIFYTKRSMGNYCYVKLTANVTRHPLTGNVIAFFTEEECNYEKVRNTLFDNILIKQFDMVSYLSDGNYGVILSDYDNVKKGSIIPVTVKGEYIHYLEAQVFPILSGTEEKKISMKNALMPSEIAKGIKHKNPYVVNITVDIDNELFYKRLDFYRVDSEADFYVILVSDTTEIRNEQIEFNKQLARALDDAEQANIAKMAFLSKMSSEIMTPMNAIISLDETALKESLLPEEVKEDLDQIGIRARYLASLMSDILDMSKIESGKMNLVKDRFSLGKFVEEINSDAASRCKEKGLNYSCSDSGETEEYFYGDEKKLKRVLINIIDNAVKFTDEGTVSMKVLQTAKLDNMIVLQFVISDTGIGISDEFIPKVFDSFSQGSKDVNGSGLGLSISKKIACLMDGDITVESEVGKGSTFTVEVTLEKTDDKKRAEFEEEITKVIAGKRVLLAEDMIVNAELMKQILLMKGIDVEYAANGKIALQIFEDSEMDYFDAVLMDIRMPEMDGLAATEAIRSLDRVDAKDVPIIALTANSYDEDVRKSLKSGMDAHLSKPVEPAVLYKILAEMIGERMEKYI